MEVVLVKHRDYGNVSLYDPCGKAYKVSELVITDDGKNRDYGTVITENHVLDHELKDPLPRILRLVNQFDKNKIEENSFREKKAFKFCRQCILARGLNMNLVAVEYSFDRKKLKFMFTSSKKVDFRELVKELVQEFKTGVELRQIGVRDAAKILGGIGPCGLMLCCHRYLNRFEPVNLKMARQQNVLSSPDKISGNCGRLRCCLRYEIEGKIEPENESDMDKDNDSMESYDEEPV